MSVFKDAGLSFVGLLFGWACLVCLQIAALLGFIFLIVKLLQFMGVL